MHRCMMHHRHTVVRLSVGSSVHQILHIFMSGEHQVLKVGQYAKNDSKILLKALEEGSRSSEVTLVHHLLLCSVKLFVPLNDSCQDE